MELFTINQETCNRDGICAAVCPTGVINFVKGSAPVPSEDAEQGCIRCGHCVAVCPTASLSHRDMAVAECPEINRDLNLSEAPCEQFLRSRRSIRVYRKKPVAKEQLARLIDIARYAPTGRNSQSVHWLVLSGREQLHHLSGLIADWMRWMIDHQPGMAASMHMDRTVAVWEAGHDVFLRSAPALIVATLIARWGVKSADGSSTAGALVHEVFANKSVVLLGGGILIGWVAGPQGLEPLSPLFVDLFKGALCLFLLEMGLIAADRLPDLKKAGLFLVGSAMLRTWDYVESYDLTVLRIAALLWMVLVAAGLMLVLWRMLREKRGAWLINANLMTSGALLFAVCFVDLGAMAAEWNVRHAREIDGTGAKLDLCYLDELGESALVPLARLELQQGESRLGRDAAVLRSRLLKRMEADRDQGEWSLRANRRIAEAHTLLGPKADQPVHDPEPCYRGYPVPVPEEPVATPAASELPESPKLTDPAEQ